MLGESSRSVARRWNAGLDAYLFPALDELPPRAQAFVAARIKAERPDAVWRRRIWKTGKSTPSGGSGSPGDAET
jgi:hypothetical protein